MGPPNDARPPGVPPPQFPGGGGGGDAPECLTRLFLAPRPFPLAEGAFEPKNLRTAVSACVLAAICTLFRQCLLPSPLNPSCSVLLACSRSRSHALLLHDLARFRTQLNALVRSCAFLRSFVCFFAISLALARCLPLLLALACFLSILLVLHRSRRLLGVLALSWPLLLVVARSCFFLF